MLIDTEMDLQYSGHLESEHGFHVNETMQMALIIGVDNTYIEQLSHYFLYGSRHQSIMENACRHVAAIMDSDMAAL